MIIRACIGQEYHTVPKLIVVGMACLKQGNSMISLAKYTPIECENIQTVGQESRKGQWATYKLDLPEESIIRIKATKATQYEKYEGECWLKIDKHAPEKRMYIESAMHQERGAWVYGNLAYLKGCDVHCEEVPLVE